MVLICIWAICWQTWRAIYRLLRRYFFQGWKKCKGLWFCRDWFLFPLKVFVICSSILRVVVVLFSPHYGKLHSVFKAQSTHLLTYCSGPFPLTKVAPEATCWTPVSDKSWGSISQPLHFFLLSFLNLCLFSCLFWSWYLNYKINIRNHPFQCPFLPR